MNMCSPCPPFLIALHFLARFIHSGALHAHVFFGCRKSDRTPLSFSCDSHFSLFRRKKRHSCDSNLNPLNCIFTLNRTKKDQIMPLDNDIVLPFLTLILPDFRFLVRFGVAGEEKLQARGKKPVEQEKFFSSKKQCKTL